MQGELNGRDPMGEVRAIFSVLSRPNGDGRHDGLITLSKLQAACHEFEVPPPALLHTSALKVLQITSFPM